MFGDPKKKIEHAEHDISKILADDVDRRKKDHERIENEPIRILSLAEPIAVKHAEMILNFIQFHLATVAVANSVKDDFETSLKLRKECIKSIEKNLPPISELIEEDKESQEELEKEMEVFEKVYQTDKTLYENMHSALKGYHAVLHLSRKALEELKDKVTNSYIGQLKKGWPGPTPEHQRVKGLVIFTTALLQSTMSSFHEMAKAMPEDIQKKIQHMQQKVEKQVVNL